MATKVFKTTVEIKKHLESACEKAVNNACKILLEKLQEFIMSEYYEKYTPSRYIRTMQFYDSATKKMLNKTCGQIFMDESAMDYNSYWDGETQLYMADAGLHGSAYIYRDGFYFKKFIEYCEENAENILKEELKKCGINVI